MSQIICTFRGCEPPKRYCEWGPDVIKTVRVPDCGAHYYKYCWNGPRPLYFKFLSKADYISGWTPEIDISEPSCIDAHGFLKPCSDGIETIFPAECDYVYAIAFWTSWAGTDECKPLFEIQLGSAS